MARTTAAARPPLRVVRAEEAVAPARLASPVLDDSQLLAALRSGDADAATALHDRVRPAVERSIRRILGGLDRDHEDLAQQAMIEVIVTIDRFRGECPLDAWVSTLAAHVVYNHIRRRSKERRLFESLRTGEGEELPSLQSLARETSARSTLRRVLAHLDHLDEAKAWAYVLHDVCGYDLREVAQITDATVSAAQTRLVRGRRELRARIEADADLVTLMTSEEGES